MNFYCIIEINLQSKLQGAQAALETIEFLPHFLGPGRRGDVPYVPELVFFQGYLRELVFFFRGYVPELVVKQSCIDLEKSR